MSIQSIPYCSPAIGLCTESALFDAFKLMLAKGINHIRCATKPAKKASCLPT